MIFSKLDHLGSSHVHTARAATNLNSNIDKSQIIGSNVDPVSHLRCVLGKWSVVECLRCGHTRLLLHAGVLAGQEILGFVLALGEVGEVPVKTLSVNTKFYTRDIKNIPVSNSRW